MALGAFIPKQLGQGNANSNTSSGTLYTVPTGCRAIIKRVSILGVNLASSGYMSVIAGSGGCTIVPESNPNNSGAGNTFDQAGKVDRNIVMEAGQTLTLFNVGLGTNVSFTVSGIEFTI
jgi:hypothetical protein